MLAVSGWRVDNYFNNQPTPSLKGMGKVIKVEPYFITRDVMSEIPYTPLTGKIKEYFAKFQEVAVPKKVNTKWLKLLGYKSGNDAYILRVLKYINFIDSSGVPTEFWRQYKDPTKSKVVLAQAIRQGYKELFATYPDANRKDREALYAFFSSKTGKAKATVDLMVSTFINLCQLADFEAEVPKEIAPTAAPEKPIPYSKIEKGIISELHINIQLHLPATTDPTVYNNLFKSLRKYLLSEEE